MIIIVIIVVQKKCGFDFSVLTWGIEGILFFKAYLSSASDNGCSFLGCFLLNEPDTGSSASTVPWGTGGEWL